MTPWEVPAEEAEDGGVRAASRVWRQRVLSVGLLGTLALVAFGLWTLVSRVWAASLTQTLEVLVAGPFLALYVMSPLLWAAWPRRREGATEADEVTSLVAAALIVALAVYAYVPEFLVLPLVFDAELALDSLLLVVVVPAGQWAILGMAAGVKWAREKG